MKASLKYPVFYLAPEEHMVHVFWREEAVTTRRLLTEAGGWAWMFRCRPEEEPSIRRSLLQFLAVAAAVGLAIWLLARYT